MHRHARQGGDFVIVRTDTILRDDVAQELNSRGSDRVLFEESSDLCKGGSYNRYVIDGGVV